MPPIDPWTTGSRGIAVRLTVAGTQVEARGALIYQPQGDTAQTTINVMATSLITPASFEGSTGAAKQASLVESLAAQKGVTLAVLPEFFAGLADSTSVRQLYPLFAQLQDAVLAEKVELVSLPQENADLSLLAATGQKDLLTAAASTRVTETDLSGSPWSEAKATLLSQVVLATDGGFTRTALRGLANNTVIAPYSWSAQDQQTGITPTGLLKIDPQTGLLAESDTQAVTVVEPWPLATELLGRPEGSAADELRIRQTLRTASLLSLIHI